MSVLPEDQENGLANLNDENLAAQPAQPAKNVTIDGSSKYADPEQGEAPAPAAVASPSAAKRWKRAGHTVVATTPVKKTLAEIVDGGIVKAASGKWEKRRIALHTMLNEPGSSTTAFVISTVITILILASTLCLVLSTESTLLDECNLKIIGPPTLRCTANSSATGQRFPDGCCISRFNWSPFELTFNVAFTIELISHIIASPTWRDALSDGFLYIDLSAILPFYVTLFISLGQGSVAVGLVKALRMIRLLKLARHFSGSIILWRSLRLSKGALAVPFFMFFNMCFLLSALLYFSEQQSSSGNPRFDSIMTSLWFLSGIMTMGYGENGPTSSGGKTVVLFSVVFGVLFLSMPLAIIGNNFHTVWHDREQSIVVEEMRSKLFKKGVSKASIMAAFTAFDEDGSGLIDFEEFKGGMAAMDIIMKKAQMLRVWQAMDQNGTGELNLSDFTDIIFNEQRIDYDDEMTDDELAKVAQNEVLRKTATKRDVQQVLDRVVTLENKMDKVIELMQTIAQK